jgi:hypothetical protein
MLKLLLSEFLYKTLFTAMDASRHISEIQTPTETQTDIINEILEEFFSEEILEMLCRDAENETILITDAIKKHSSHLQSSIPVLSDEEFLHLQNENQKNK